jgi:hypothetical protein
MGTLKDLIDLATSEDGVYPMPTIMASTLQMMCKLNDLDYTWPSSGEPSLFQLIQLIEDALYLDAPIALKHIQRAIASRLNGKRAPELCTLIGAGSAFGSAEEHAPQNAEPAFVPADIEAPQQPASSTAPPEYHPSHCSSPRSRRTPWRLLWAWWTWPRCPRSRT